METERKAFDVIAGCSHGGVTNREFALAILADITEELGFSDTSGWYTDLAETHDEDEWLANGDAINDLAQFFNDNSYTLPPFCHLEIRDNEAIILPSMDLLEFEDIIKFDRWPEDFQAEYILFVNDHGNVTLLKWTQPQNAGFGLSIIDASGKYVEVWSMV